MTSRPIPDFTKLPNLQDIDQLREETAFNDAVSWALDDESVMLEVVRALHTDVPVIEHGWLIRAVLTRDPVDMLKARAVVNEAFQFAALNRVNRVKIIQEEL